MAVHTKSPATMILLLVGVAVVSLASTTIVRGTGIAQFNPTLGERVPRRPASSGDLRGTPTSEYGNLTLVADGYTWIENIFFDNQGAMYFSDSFEGKVMRVTRASATGGAFVSETWLSGFGRVLGFALTEDETEMFAVAWLSKTEYNIIAFSLSTPQTYRVLATTEYSGNGLGLDAATNILFTASEGDFIPGNGRVYAMNMTGIVNASNGPQATVQLFDDGLDAADGLWIDHTRRIMYVSEVLNATVRMYNLSLAHAGAAAALFGQYKAPGMTMLDDFSVSSAYCSSGIDTMFGADFWAGNVVAFPSDGSDPSSSVVLASGLFNPTSVRPGRGSGFTNGRTLYVSEGGGLDALTTNRRLWQLTLDDRFVC